MSERSIPATSDRCFLYSDSWGLADHGVRIIATLGNLSYDQGKVMQMSKRKQLKKHVGGFFYILNKHDGM